MGDPKRHRKKYSTPTHPWQKERIEQEKELRQIYCFKNKKELWKADSMLRGYMSEVKKITALRTAQSQKEGDELLQKMVKLGLLSQDAKLSDILNIELKQLLERRLQTILFRKGLARTMQQARQFIVHRHVSVNGKVINVPSYIVSVKEENSIGFKGTSGLNDPEHPERATTKKSENGTK